MALIPRCSHQQLATDNALCLVSLKLPVAVHFQVSLFLVVHQSLPHSPPEAACSKGRLLQAFTGHQGLQCDVKGEVLAGQLVVEVQGDLPTGLINGGNTGRQAVAELDLKE